MSVQVSYKKQTLLGIIGLLILFLVIEGFANIWWTTQINCEFEDNEIFEQMNDTKKRQLCVDLYEIRTSNMELVPDQKSESITINSLGFRGPEFSSTKSTDEYRIFLIGGSTIFGHGSTSDQTTIPGYLQTYFNTDDVEIINSGIQGADSFIELNLIKTKLLNLSPDMVIVYDGWNDLRAETSSNLIHQNWNSMCKLGQEYNFEVVIILQPIAGFGNKPLTTQETKFSQLGENYAGNLLIDSFGMYDEYTQKLTQISDCNYGYNFRSVFDDETSPVYWDQGHVSDLGNSIIAKSIYNSIENIIPADIVHTNIITTNENIDTRDNVDSQLTYIISGYKTPLMINSFFLFDIFDFSTFQPPSESPSTISGMPSIFTTNPKVYKNDEIFIQIEVLTIDQDFQKIIKIQTINNVDQSSIPNVTYFLKISKDNKIILSDFFYAKNNILILDVISENHSPITIEGKRQYDHNAIIFDDENPILISGDLLSADEKYTFDIELRTIYDSSNWVFSLDGFNVEIIP